MLFFLYIEDVRKITIAGFLLTKGQGAKAEIFLDKVQLYYRN